MKQIKYLYLPLFVLIILSFSCKKDKQPVTRVVEFKSTTYQALGAYDSLGKPAYLQPRDIISPALLAFIKVSLPDRQDLTKTNPDLFTNKAIADITITTASNVFITYVSQGGSLTNSFAFYTYPTNHPPASTEDIKTITYIFPSSGSGTPLERGDKVKLGRFEPGTSVGFVLLQKGWDALTHTLNNKVVHFCSNDVLNPEVDVNLKKHAVLINYLPEGKVLIGMEDTDRTLPACDNDFNDVVFYCTVTP
ncbi:hypothetical protein BH11BAC3_BH11BAC3_39630 [soil metagenome]